MPMYDPFIYTMYTHNLQKSSSAKWHQIFAVVQGGPFVRTGYFWTIRLLENKNTKISFSNSLKPLIFLGQHNGHHRIYVFWITETLQILNIQLFPRHQ